MYVNGGIVVIFFIPLHITVLLSLRITYNLYLPPPPPPTKKKDEANF